MPRTVILRGPSQRQFAKELINQAPDNYVVKISEGTRTGEQNSKMWAMLTEISNACPEDRRYTPETWKCVFMHSLGHQVQFAQGLDGAGPIPLGFKSSKLRKEQMSDLIEVIYEYGARHGVQFNDDIKGNYDEN